MLLLRQDLPMPSPLPSAEANVASMNLSRSSSPLLRTTAETDDARSCMARIVGHGLDLHNYFEMGPSLSPVRWTAFVKGPVVSRSVRPLRGAVGFWRISGNGVFLNVLIIVSSRDVK